MVFPAITVVVEEAVPYAAAAEEAELIDARPAARADADAAEAALRTDAGVGVGVLKDGVMTAGMPPSTGTVRGKVWPV